MTDFPRLRSLAFCPECGNPKTKGTIFCWPCFNTIRDTWFIERCEAAEARIWPRKEYTVEDKVREELVNHPECWD